MKFSERLRKRFGFLSISLSTALENDPFTLFLMALLVGLYVLFVLIVAFLPRGITEQEESKIFVLGWVLAPICAVLSVPLLVWVQQKFLQETPKAMQILLATNSILAALLVTGVNLSYQWEQPHGLVNRLAFASILIIPVVNLAVIQILKQKREQIPNWGWAGLTIAGGAGALNFIALFPYLQNQYSVQFPYFILAVLVGAAALFIKKIPVVLPKKSWLLFGVDLTVILLTILACFDASFSINQLHENFYLGPANRIFNGRTMLVDTFSQYGVLVIYFLALIFKIRLIPFTYQGVNLLLSILLIAQFFPAYLLLVRLTKNRFYAVLLLIVALWLGLFGTMGVLQAFPSTGPLRFGPAYLILGVVYLRRRFPRLSNTAKVVEHLLVGLSFLWSFETAVYSTFAYLGTCLYDSLIQNPSFGQAVKLIFRRVGWVLVTLALTYGFFEAATFLRAGQWPDWGIYFDYFKAYSIDGFGTLPVDLWGPWIFQVAIYFASLMAFVFMYVYRQKIDHSPEAEFIFGMTLAGIAIFTYFLGRSHPNNLYLTSLPAVVTAGYWFIQINHSKRIPEPFQRAAKFAFFSAAALIILTIYPTVASKVQQNNTGFRIAAKSLYAVIRGRQVNILWEAEREALYRGSQSQRTADALVLLKKFTPGQPDITLFLSTYDTTEILFLSRKIHSFPINDPVEDAISNQIMQKIFTYPHHLQPGDMVFVESNPLYYQKKVSENRVPIRLIDRLCHEFHFEEVEKTPSGILAIRLGQFNGTTSDYCSSIKTINDSLASMSQ